MNNNQLIFPCKSINLVRWLKTKNIYAVHKYTDITDLKECWIYIMNDKLSNALTYWRTEKPTLIK